MSRDFAVWAPRAGTVELQAGTARLPLQKPDGDGWWRLADTAAVPEGEADYGYLLDGEDRALPDPRSRRQPDGVHGLSRTFDAGAHAWRDQDWVSPGLGGVVYELHIGTFTPEGTLDAAAGKLDYLAGLGVDYVELLPVNAFNGTHNWGYDGVLWFAVQETYGGPSAYQRFVDAAHAKGIGVIQDVVYNHLGPSGNYLPRFGPYLSTGSGNTWGDSVNLDGPGSDEVRRFITDNVQMWFRDYHVDGLRLDAVHALRDERAVHILEEIAAVTDACAAELGKPLFLIAESDLNNPRLIESRESNGYGLAGQWSDDFHHAVHVNLTGETSGYYADFAGLGALEKVLRNGFFHDGSYSSFRERHHGRPINKERVAAPQLVVCTQNHDQIGNRAAGDRLTGSLGYGHLALAAVLNLTAPFTPMLFMGEEFAASTPWQFFTSHPEPELGEATSAGRLKEFERMGWDPQVVPDPQDPSTFRNSKLDWSEPETGDHARMLELYQRLIVLRKQNPELTEPDFAAVSVQTDPDAGWLILHRGPFAICCNFSAEPRTLPAATGNVVLATDDGAAFAAGTAGGASPGGTGAFDGLVLPAHSAAIVRSGAAARIGCMAAAEDLFEGPAAAPPLPVYASRALYRPEAEEPGVRHVGGYAPFVRFCAQHGEDAAGLAADPVRLLKFLRTNTAALLAEPEWGNAAEVFAGNTVVAQRPDAQWRSVEGGVTEAGDHEMSLVVQGLVERLHAADAEQFAESLATIRDWAESDPEPLPRFEEHDGNLPRPVPLPAGWKPYVRPEIPAEVYLDADGALIPYGTRWGDSDAASDSYSVTSNTDRFSGLHTVADSLIEHLVATYAASIRDVTAERAARMRGQVSVLRAVRVDPAGPDAAPLVFTFTDFPGVLLHSGLLHSTPFPSCGCDGCDETLDSEAAGLEQQVLAVAAGGFAERYPLGNHRRAEYQLVRVDGSGWEGGGGEPSHDYTDDQLAEAERTLKLLPDGWQPWPLRQQRLTVHPPTRRPTVA